jgi:hypothetical protein
MNKKGLTMYFQADRSTVIVYLSGLQYCILEQTVLQQGSFIV